MHKANSRILLLALILLLPSVFLHQMVPHHHAEPEHTHSGEIPEPPGQLPHSHDGDHDADQDAHHCRLTNHLDSHSFAKPDGDQDLDILIVIVGLVDIPTPRPTCSIIPIPDGRDPDTTPRTSGAPRAPPLLG